MFPHSFFVLIAILFSIVYARIEFGLDKWWVELGKSDEFWRNKWGKYTPYHLWMLFLDSVVNLPALYVAQSVPLFLACVLMFPLLEDIFYFVWRGRWIEDEAWTGKDLGMWKIWGFNVPKWYAVAGAAIGLLLLFA